jgi:hypothetical protein
MLLTLLAFSVVGAATPPPADTMAAFYSAANRAAYVEALGYWAPETASTLKKGLKEFCNEQTAGRTLERVEVLKQEVRGDRAEVRMELYFTSGLAVHTGSLVRQNGVWKILYLGS